MQEWSTSRLTVIVYASVYFPAFPLGSSLLTAQMQIQGPDVAEGRD